MCRILLKEIKNFPCELIICVIMWAHARKKKVKGTLSEEVSEFDYRLWKKNDGFLFSLVSSADSDELIDML